jgi:hypothetical protein
MGRAESGGVASTQDDSRKRGMQFIILLEAASCLKSFPLKSDVAGTRQHKSRNPVCMPSVRFESAVGFSALAPQRGAAQAKEDG